MKFKLEAFTLSVFGAGDTFAQATDAGVKVKASGIVIMGVRDASGSLL